MTILELENNNQTALLDPSSFHPIGSYPIGFFKKIPKETKTVLPKFGTVILLFILLPSPRVLMVSVIAFFYANNNTYN